MQHDAATATTTAVTVVLTAVEWRTSQLRKGLFISQLCVCVVCGSFMSDDCVFNGMSVIA